MADSKSATPDNASASSVQNPAPRKPPNPAFRMMGMPNFRFKLPSRNWLIFLSLSGSLASAIYYDRYHKKKAQQKWCRLVSHLAEESLPANTMPRKLTIFLSAPPADSLKASREYFNDYVKPILVAGALDWEVIEGRREGDVRAGLADKIRQLRKARGEEVPSAGNEGAEAEGASPQQDELVQEIRRNSGVREWEGMRGDIVIGRHVWKEYIRGLHEGCLGPLELPPSPPSPEEASPTPDASSPSEDSPTEKPTEKPAETPKPPAKPTPKPAYIPASMAVYTSTPLPTSILDSNPIQPSTPIPQPHILGFFNTPIRTWRFLNQRYLAEQVGRETAAVVLAAHTRPYGSHPQPSSSPSESDDKFADHPSPLSGQQQEDAPRESTETQELSVALAHEESNWHKNIRKRTEPNALGVSEERVWLDDMVIDPRIAARMSRFQLGAEDEARANRIAEGKEQRSEDGKISDSEA
ncbi:MAG: hypothetical protein M4579_003714 [Chaenotheca gracillima]|nr:MAG: hypothetical protein M4579_003714 [Chaenotheca gracillima]